MKASALDMTKGNPFVLLLKFTWPIYIGSAFQQIYNLVDAVIVGNFVGENALASVNVTATVVNLLFSLINGVASGVGVVVAQYYGARDQKGIQRTFATSLYVMGGLTVIITLLGVVFSRGILQLLKAPEGIIDDAVSYLTAVFLGTVATVLYNLMASVLRGLGDSVTPLIFLIMASVLNVGLDLLFIIVFHMGVLGAGVATVLSQAISGVLCVIYALRKMLVLHLKRHELKLDRVIMSGMLKIGLPAGFEMAFISFSQMIVQSVINGYGTSVVAGFGAASKVETLIAMFGYSLGTAAGTYAGHNVGAGNFKRVEEGFQASVVIIAVSSVIMSLVTFFGAQPIMSLFLPGGEGIEAGCEYLHIIAFFLFFLWIMSLCRNILRCAGDVSISIIMGGWEICSRVMFVSFLPGLLGRIGVWWVTPITWTTTMVIGLVRYLSGKWKQKALVSNNTEQKLEEVDQEP